MITKEHRKILNKARLVADTLEMMDARIELYFAKCTISGGSDGSIYIQNLRAERDALVRNWLDITDSQEYKAAVEADTA
jgi:hypothetical protein